MAHEIPLLLPLLGLLVACSGDKATGFGSSAGACADTATELQVVQCEEYASAYALCTQSQGTGISEAEAIEQRCSCPDQAPADYDCLEDVYADDRICADPLTRDILGEVAALCGTPDELVGIVTGMPMDGERAWVYVNQERTVDFYLRVDKANSGWVVSQPEPQVYAYSDYETGRPLYEITWSSGLEHGVYLHTYTAFETDGSAAEQWDLDPPVQLGLDFMTLGQTVQTQSGGRTYTATLEAVAPCPNAWAPDPSEVSRCRTLRLADDGTPAAPFTGQFVLTPRAGMAGLQLRDDPALWDLVDLSWGAPLDWAPK